MTLNAPISPGNRLVRTQLTEILQETCEELRELINQCETLSSTQILNRFETLVASTLNQMGSSYCLVNLPSFSQLQQEPPHTPSNGVVPHIQTN